jgi:hypothetical protein
MRLGDCWRKRQSSDRERLSGVESRYNEATRYRTESGVYEDSITEPRVTGSRNDTTHSWMYHSTTEPRSGSDRVVSARFNQELNSGKLPV